MGPENSKPVARGGRAINAAAVAYSSSCYEASDAANPTTQSAITAAVIQPTTFSQRDNVKRPITRGLLAKCIITTIIGAAITPLMIALQ